jgi:hypothetical protein
MHIVSKKDREAYKLDLDLITNDSRELSEAEPDIGGNARAYRIKRTNGSVTFGQRLSCDTQLRKELKMDPFTVSIPGHKGLPANCCAHVLRQDPVHPEGFRLMPYGLFLCKTCFNLMERCRFFYKDMIVNCRDCVEHRAIKLREINPELFDDLRVRKD